MIVKTRITRLLPLITLLFFQSHATAEIYKWVDEDGQVHYGEQTNSPNAKKIIIRQNETTKPRTIKKTETDKNKSPSDEIENPDTEAQQPKKTEPPKISRKEKRRLCNEAKNNIAIITSRGQMREINKKGEYIYLSEKKRQQRLSAARKRQREFCR